MIEGFNDKLKKLRLARGLNIKEFSQLISISDSMILRYESGERQPSLKVLCKLATCLGVSTDYLLGMERSKDHLPALAIDLSNLTPKQIECIKSIVKECEEMNKFHG